MSKSTRQKLRNTRHSEKKHFDGATDKFVKDVQVRSRKRQIEKASRKRNRK